MLCEIFRQKIRPTLCLINKTNYYYKNEVINNNVVSFPRGSKVCVRVYMYACVCGSGVYVSV